MVVKVNSGEIYGKRITKGGEWRGRAGTERDGRGGRAEGRRGEEKS